VTPVGDGNRPGEETVGYEQARRLRATMVAAGIDRARLWLHYFSIGGDVGEYELDAYLHHSLLLPCLQRDLLAQAANEILLDVAPPQAPYASDIRTDRAAAGEPAAGDTEPPAPDAGGADGTDPGNPDH
jgi:hypothetical protein